MKTATLRSKPSTKFEKAQPFDPIIHAAAIKAWLLERLDINSDVWSVIFELVNGRSHHESPLFPDSAALYDETRDVATQIQARGGNRLFNRYEKVWFEMRERYARTAYAAGWVAAQQQLEPVVHEALDLSDVAERVVGLTTMLTAVFAAMPSLDAVVVKESCSGFADVVELVRAKVEGINAGLRRISDLFKTGGAR